jgi:cyclase
MSVTKRIIPCLDVKDGRTVKGVNFAQLRDAGDPIELAAFYAKCGADELVFLDITASHERRSPLMEIITKIGERLDIPFTVGGGVQSLEDAKGLLKAGADKVSLNSAAVKDPSLISKIQRDFGSQAVVVAIDGKCVENEWYVFINGGRINTQLKVLEWAKEAVARGAGEILLTSMDHDGMKDGFAYELTSSLKELPIPIIASGGAGSLEHFALAFTEGYADAALASSVFHFGEIDIRDLKRYLKERGIFVREVGTN